MRAVFAVIARHVAPGEARKVAAALPAEIRALWPTGEAVPRGDKVPAAG